MFRDAEASDAGLVMRRIAGAILVIGGIVLILMSGSFR